MGYPSATFSDASAGRLEVHFSARFASGPIGDSPSWTGGGGPASMVIRCTVTDAASNVYTAFINMTSPTAVLVLPYPGGGAAWTVAMALQSWGYSGIGYVESIEPRITTILIKR